MEIIAPKYRCFYDRHICSSVYCKKNAYPKIITQQIVARGLAQGCLMRREGPAVDQHRNQNSSFPTSTPPARLAHPALLSLDETTARDVLKDIRMDANVAGDNLSDALIIVASHHGRAIFARELLKDERVDVNAKKDDGSIALL